LIIHALSEIKNETLDQLVKTMEDLWSKLGVSGILVNNVHRLRKPKDGHTRPAIVKLVRYIDKRLIMSNKSKVLVEKIFIYDDKTKDEQQNYKLLRTKLQELKATEPTLIGTFRGTDLLVKKTVKPLYHFQIENGVIKSL